MGWILVGMLAWAVPMQAATANWYATSLPEMAAHRGATHYALIKSSDFSAVTTTNTALSITNAINAKTGVEFVELMMDTAFDTGNTNYTGSVDLKIGDGSDDDLFLTSTELASDGTEVFIKYGPPNAATIASVLTRQAVNALTNVSAQTYTPTFILADGTTNTTAICTNVAQLAISVLTNATVASTATIGELGRKLYTSSGQIVFTVTPNTEEALSANTSGEVRCYFRLTKFR
jgi:hypothetical protein